MASSIQLKDRRSPAASVQTNKSGRRTPRSSVPSSPEGDAQPPARKSLSRSSSSDMTVKVGKAPSTATAIPSPAKLRLPAKKAAPEKPPSLSRQPLKPASPKSAGSVKDRAARPSATVARAAASAKPASATKILKPSGAAAPSPVRVKSPAGVVSRRKETDATAAASPRRAREELVYTDEREAKEFESASVTSTEDHFQMIEDKAEEVADEQINDTVEEKVEEAAEINDATEEGQGKEVVEEHEPTSPPKLELDVDGEHSDEKPEAETNEETDGEPSPSVSTEEAEETPVEAPPEKVEPEPVEESPAATEATTLEKAEEDAEEHKDPSADEAEKSKEEPEECKEKERPAVLVFKKPASATTPPEKKDTPQISNNVLEQTRSKLLQRKKSKVGALVGAFETVISLQDESQP